MSMLDFEEVEPIIKNAMASGDKDALWRGLNDLSDAGITEITLVSRHVTITGKLIESEVAFPSNKLRIVCEGISKAEKLFLRLKWIKDGQRSMRGESLKYFKHENEMSPEEYEWFKGA